MRQSGLQRGFSTLEQVLMLAIVATILALVISARSSDSQAKRNNERQQDIQTLRNGLESYFTIHHRYPNLQELNDSAWRSGNLKSLPDNAFQDPSGTGETAGMFAAKPKSNSYSYSVTSTSGNSCGTPDKVCTHYTLTATMEGGTSYTKTNLN